MVTSDQRLDPGNVHKHVKTQKTIVRPPYLITNVTNTNRFSAILKLEEESYSNLQQLPKTREQNYTPFINRKGLLQLLTVF